MKSLARKNTSSILDDEVDAAAACSTGGQIYNYFAFAWMRPVRYFFANFISWKILALKGGSLGKRETLSIKEFPPASSIETNQINFSLNLGHSMIHGLGILKRIYVKSRCILLKAFWLQIFLHTSFTNAIVDVIKFSVSDFRISKKTKKKQEKHCQGHNCWK